MSRLCRENLNAVTASKPQYERENAGIGIVHLGAGAFFKAHQAVYTDDAMAKSGGDWDICAVSLNSTGAKDSLAPQDGLYTLKIMGEQPEYRVIGAVKEVLAGITDRADVIVRIAAHTTRIVTLTITEKGYCLEGGGALDFSHEGISSDLLGEGLPVTAIGVLTAALAKRFSSGAPSITIISCDNVSENGSKLRRAILQFSARKDAKLSAWIEANIVFPNTMVDSITPASDAALLTDVKAAIGLTDKAPVHRERFTDWVIEDFDGPRPAWDLAGAVFAPDVTPYEQTKLRLVNAPHSALTYLGLLSGIETVSAAMEDAGLRDYFYALTERELIASLGASELIDFPNYRDRIGARFANKSIRHELFQIATDGSAKLPQRFLPPLEINHQAGRSTGYTALAIAAWMRYVLQTLRAGDILNDPLRDGLAEIAKQSSGESGDDVRALLGLGEIFPQSIAGNEALTAQIIGAYEALKTGGVAYALSGLK